MDADLAAALAAINARLDAIDAKLAATPPAKPPAKPPADERDRLTAQRQAYYDKVGDLGQFTAFADVIANAGMNGAPFADQFTYWQKRLQESAQELADADKPYQDQGTAWQSVVAVENDDIDRNFNTLPYPARFVYLGAVAPHRAIAYFPGADLGKLGRDVFSTPLGAGGTQKMRAALNCDGLPYSGDVSILPVADDRPVAQAWLRHAGGPPFDGDEFPLPFGPLDLHEHGG